MFIRPCKGPITSLYGKRSHPKTGELGRMHWGVDYGNHSDNTIFAAASGTVRFVDDTRNGRTGFGKYLIITHSNGWETLYAHLSSINVKVGQKVKQRQKIGVKGTTGTSTGIHLHFEISKGKWNNKYSTNVNPLLQFVDTEVKGLQGVLKGLGYSVTVDGYYGENTKQAVIKYQKSKGLDADGVAGRSTMNLINKEKTPTATKPTTNPTTKSTGGAKPVEYEKNPKLNNSTQPEFLRAIEEGITNGEYPLRPATRQETAVMILRGMDKLRKEFEQNG